MKKILISLSMIGAVAAVAIGATGAFFTDTETSTGNTFIAGAIDLGISNDSYYNGQVNSETSWSRTFDLNDGGGAYLFFDFNDLKPGDWGEDTIDIEVNSNDAWLCADVTLDTDQENLPLTDPEKEAGDNPNSTAGELASEVNFFWWADDGNNVFEDNETLLPAGTLADGGLGVSNTVTLADSTGSIFDPTNGGPITANQVYYIGKYWCFGNATPNAVPAGQGTNPTVDPGFTCDGSSTSNLSQTDSLTATIAFRAEQERNNPDFVCSQQQPT